MAAVEVRRVRLPEVSLRDALRYAGVRTPAEDDLLTIKEAARLLDGRFSDKVVFGIFPCKISGNTVDMGFSTVSSASLAAHLFGCDSAVIMCATVGSATDREIIRAERTSPREALMISSLGSERIEALCDSFCRELSEQMSASDFSLTGRFSAGYGDLPLSFQKDVFRVLTPEKYIGLTLNGSLIMSPSKSVSAVMGIKRK